MQEEAVSPVLVIKIAKRKQQIIGHEIIEDTGPGGSLEQKDIESPMRRQHGPLVLIS